MRVHRKIMAFAHTPAVEALGLIHVKQLENLQ